jgi:iron complex outermembrane receptor protein
MSFPQHILSRGYGRGLILCSLLFLTAASTPAVASILLAGRVSDADTGAPLANANIQIQGRDLGTISAAGGYFTLSKVPGEPLTLVVTFVGYEPTLLALDPTKLADGEEISVTLKPMIYAGEEIVVTASRYDSDVHLSHTNLSRDEIRQRHSEVDIPLLLIDTPGLYATSDAGNGVGYTYLKIRGFDQRRVGVMINGIPLNDPEDHQVYWVNMPDLVSSLQDVQIQRGVANSVGGMAAIGGTVNLVTEILPVAPAGRLSLFGGSYGTAKQSLSYSTGLLGGRFASSLRVSHLESDGYRQRAGSDQWAMFWSGRYVTPNSATQINIYTGRELTHHAWDPVDEQTLAADRTSNPETYHNAVDDFRQPHYELHHRWNLSERMALTNSIYLVHGEGFYENFKADRDVDDFSLRPRLAIPDSIETMDLVRQKWVRKDQVGWVPQLMVEHAGGRTVIGGHAYTFHSNHWGDVIWVEGFTPDHFVEGLKYYDYEGDKDTWSLFVNERYEVISGLTLLMDLQYQHIHYDFLQNEVGNFRGDNGTRHGYTVKYDFFNPKGGLYWRLPRGVAGGELGLYGHVGVSHREPADADLFDTWDGPDDLGVAPLFHQSSPVYDADGMVAYLEWSDPLVSEERVLNYEVGTAFRSDRFSLTVNGYLMEFTDEIIPYGTVDDDGYGIKGNAEKTLHRGIEAGFTARPHDNHTFTAAVSRSWDEFDTFTFYDWDGTPSDYSGNPIALFPRHLVSASWRGDWGSIDSSVRFRNVGRQYLDNTGDEERTIDAYSVVDLGLSVDLAGFGWASLSGASAELHVRNVLDEEYETSGYYDGWGAGNYKLPAAGRNFLVGVHYDF